MQRNLSFRRKAKRTDVGARGTSCSCRACQEMPPAAWGMDGWMDGWQGFCNKVKLLLTAVHVEDSQGGVSNSDNQPFLECSRLCLPSDVWESKRPQVTRRVLWWNSVDPPLNNERWTRFSAPPSPAENIRNQRYTACLSPRSSIIYQFP